MLEATCFLYFRLMFMLLPFLWTVNHGDARHSGPNGLFGKQLPFTQGSWDKLEPCWELSANLILLFRNEPHSNVISADGGSKAKISGYKWLYIHWQQCIVSSRTLNTKFETTYCGQRMEPKPGLSFPYRVVLRLGCESESHGWLVKTVLIPLTIDLL